MRALSGANNFKKTAEQTFGSAANLDRLCNKRKIVRRANRALPNLTDAIRSDGLNGVCGLVGERVSLWATKWVLACGKISAL